MSEYIAGRIKKPNHRLIYDLNPVYRRKNVIGFDSEADTTAHGQPMMFQYSLPNTAEEDTLLEILPPTPYAGLFNFLDFLNYFCTSADFEHLIYGWNTAYELTQIFHDLPERTRIENDFIVANIPNAKGGTYGWNVKVSNTKRQIIVFQRGRVRVRLLDGTGFYKISLDAAARMLGVGEKYELSSLSRSTFTRDDLTDPDYIRYAKRDAYITRLIGEYIQDQHKQLGIPTTISAPHFAATVFKTTFLTNPVAAPSNDLEQAGLYSYHGGKNGFYLDGPSEFPMIYLYDITSAYPEAMKQLPNIETGNWSRISKYKPDIHGLFCVTMDYRACRYTPLQNHNGTRTVSGLVTDVWITSYELDAILRRGEATIIRCWGFQFTGGVGGPLSDYVDRFFTLKRFSSGPERETAKLLLNSLYGKFFQKQPIGSVGVFDLDRDGWKQADPDETYDYEAGGLYHPPIASLITGYVRAKIHGMEHKYESVMTSTDGLFGSVPPDRKDLGSDLGQLTATRGHLRIWRERLYIFDAEDGKRKFALHGFHAKVSDLDTIPLARGQYYYYGNQMMTLKMSTKSYRGVSYKPGEFARLQYLLDI